MQSRIIPSTPRGVLVACCDLRPKYPEAKSALGLALMSIPGVDLKPTPELVNFWKENYPGLPFIAAPHPDECHWYGGSYDKAYGKAYTLSVYMRTQGVPSACVSFHDGWARMEYNGLFGHNDLASDILGLVNSKGFDWSYNVKPVASDLVIGHHHWVMPHRALRISAQFLTEGVLPRIRKVLDTFRGGKKIHTHFSREVPLERQQQLVNLFRRYEMPVIIH